MKEFLEEIINDLQLLILNDDQLKDRVEPILKKVTLEYQKLNNDRIK